MDAMAGCAWLSCFKPVRFGFHWFGLFSLLLVWFFYFGLSCWVRFGWIELFHVGLIQVVAGFFSSV